MRMDDEAQQRTACTDSIEIHSHTNNNNNISSINNNNNNSNTNSDTNSQLDDELEDELEAEPQERQLEDDDDDELSGHQLDHQLGLLNDTNNNKSSAAPNELIVKQLARLEHQLATLEDKFRAQDMRLMAIESANREILLKLGHLTLALESLASPSVSSSPSMSPNLLEPLGQQQLAASQTAGSNHLQRTCNSTGGSLLQAAPDQVSQQQQQHQHQHQLNHHRQLIGAHIRRSASPTRQLAPANNRRQHLRHHHNHHHHAAISLANADPNTTSSSQQSSGSASPSLGAHSALSTSAASPAAQNGPLSHALAGSLNPQSASQFSAAVAAGLSQQSQQEQQSTVAAMAAASQFLSALARSQVGGQLSELDHLAQSRLLASTLSAAASVGNSDVATNLTNHLAKQNNTSNSSSNINNNNQSGANQLLNQRQLSHSQSVAQQLASAAAAAAAAGLTNNNNNNNPLGSQSAPNNPNNNAQVVHSIPHPHSHHALSHPAASLLINNPHYQTVRTKYSTRRYSRRRVGPEEAMADPAIRATVQLKMQVVPKTILIVLKHRLTVQTAITLACAQTGERLRKGAIQKKLEAMFREPGAVDSFLAEWDHPR